MGVLRRLDDLMHWIDYRRGRQYRQRLLCRAWRRRDGVS